MKSVKSIIEQILNPRAKYGKMPGFDESVEDAEGLGGKQASSFHVRDILRNFPLMVGLIIVAMVFIVVVFGPLFAPFNPYISGQHIQEHMDFERDVYVRPPIAPSDIFPEFPLGTNQWGSDLLSMLLHGARNTVILSGFITLVRVIVGLTLGAMAGWNEGKFIDRLLMGIMGLITSLPLLISSMILIFVLDIRGGLMVFIVALSVLGWSEIAQYVRSEFLILRKASYIEGAQAAGLRGIQIAVRHVIPNVLPQLLVISFLEMGAVLMLLGELGFVGVYIGGGSRLDISDMFEPANIVTLIEIPEWGAMIADGFRWVYTAPHIVMAPAAAFFISVLGFNALGEGFRRLIEQHAINTSFLLKKRMMAIIVGISFATIFIINNTGAGPWYSRVAGDFDVDGAMQTMEILTELDGRGVGQAGGEEAAAYIAEQFEEAGLHPGWKRNTWFYPFETTIVRAIEQPALLILDEDGDEIAEFQHQLDFGYMIEGHAGSGQVNAQVVFVGFQPGAEQLEWSDYSGLDLAGKIVLLFEENAPESFATEAMVRGAVGVLWVTGDGRDDVRSQIQFADENTDYLRSPNLPVFRIRPEVADQIFNESGTNRTELFDLIAAERGADVGWLVSDLDVHVDMSVSLGEPQAYEVPSVLGYFPGADFDLGRELVVVYVSYDGLGLDPDGTVYPGANHNAAGVAVMVEIAKLWNEQGLSPKRTVMFIAWGGGSLDDSGARAMVEDSFTFRHLISASSGTPSPTIFVQLDYIGAGGDVLLAHPESSPQLFDLLVDTNAESGTMIIEADADTEEFTTDIITQRIRSWISIKWQGDILSPDKDLFGILDRAKLQQLGEFLTLILTKIARETNF